MIHLSEQVKLAELGTELAIVKSHGQHTYLEEGPPRGFWDLGRMAIFFFRELGSTGNYFRGAREQANNFGD